MNNDGIEKLKAHVESLHRLLIRVYTQFLFLRPMMVNHSLIARMGKEGKRVGFEQLRDLLYWNFILELVKVCDDKDKKVPSIRNIAKKLEDQNTRILLENEHSRSALPRVKGESEKTWERFRKQDEEELRKKFQETYEIMRKNSDELLTSNSLKKYKKIRDNLIAHNELQKVDGHYQFLDIKELNLTYGQERILLESSKDIIDDLQSLVLNSCFSWDSFFIPEKREVCKFWEIETIEPDVNPNTE